MLTKSVTIYDRGPDGIYLHPSAFSEMGVLVAIPPFVHLAMAEKEPRIWREVVALMESSGGRVSHPKPGDDILRPLYQMAGCSNWQAFVRKATSCAIDIVDGQFIVSPEIRDESGFGSSKEAKIALGLNPTESEGKAAVLAALRLESM